MKKVLSFGAVALFVVGMASVSFGADANAGKVTFETKCTLCHGKDGKGQTPTGKALKPNPATNLTASKLKDDEKAATIKNGKNAMPKFGAQLSDAKIADVVAYIKTLK